MRSIFTAVLIVVLSPVLCRAQALADRVPADAMLYVGWNGSNSLGAGYDGSHLKAVMQASEFGKFINESIPALINRVAQQDADSAQMLQLVVGIGGPLWRHPTALYFGGVDLTSGVPKVALLCDAGDDAPALSQQVADLMKQGPQNDPVQLKSFGNLVVISTFEYSAKPDSALSDNAEFKATMGKLGAQPVVALYVDGVGANALIDQMVAKNADPGFQASWPQVRDQLGISGLKRIGWTSGFDGKDWSDQIFVDAPSPRTGLLAMMDSPALSDDIFKLIPVTATEAGGGTFDMGALIKEIRGGVQQVSPDASQQLDQGLAQINQMLGMDIQTQLLDAFGSEWAYYSDPTTSGSGGLGFTLLNRPRDPAQLETSLAKLEDAANGLIKQAMQQPNITIEFRQEDLNGVHMHYLATPLVSPAWTIKDGTWYFALYPQVIASALNRPADAKTILDNPAFTDVRQRLGAPDKVTSFSFQDLPKVAPDGYQGWLMMSRLYLGVGDIFGMQVPPLVLPPLDKITPELDACGSAGWSDDAGFHVKSVVPFPGAELLGAGSNIASYSVAEDAMLVSIMLPSLNRARETANRVKDAADLRSIGQGILLYSNDNKGKLPPDLGTLLKTEDITGDVFLSPMSNTKLPPNWAQMTPDDQAAWVNQNSDYVFIAPTLTMTQLDPTIVTVYGKPGIDPDGENMLFGDGHVEWEAATGADTVIQQSQDAIKAKTPPPPAGGGM